MSKRNEQTKETKNGRTSTISATRSLTAAIAAADLAGSDAKISTSDVSEPATSSRSATEAPVDASRERTICPPGPMTSRRWSLRIVTVVMRGAVGRSSARGAAMTAEILSRISRRAVRASSVASRMRELRTPFVLMSKWTAVIPLAVPATL